MYVAVRHFLHERAYAHVVCRFSAGSKAHLADQVWNQSMTLLSRDESVEAVPFYPAKSGHPKTGKISVRPPRCSRKVSAKAMEIH